MRSIFRLLGLEPPETGDRGDREERDTETVRRIAAELDRLEPGEARFLAAFAYVLARVAHADLEVSPEEVEAMERLVREFGELPQSQAALVVQIAKAQTVAFGGTENYLVTRQYRELSTKEQRLNLLRCLFAVAAADESISEVENAQISQIAHELVLTRQEVTSVRASFREKLAVLKDFPGR